MLNSNQEHSRKLVAVIACRNKGSRLYGKPLQNLDVENGVTILDNIIDCLKTIPVVECIVLAIAEGTENQLFVDIAKKHNVNHIIGSESDVLLRLIRGGQMAGASDVFRVTSESPFMHFDFVEQLWQVHVDGKYDCTFLDQAIDGCGFEILSLQSLEQSHQNGEARHRSELCTLYIRENPDQFRAIRHLPPAELIRKDLRLTVDNPEDLVVCRKIYAHFKSFAPRVPIPEIIKYLDDNPELKALVAPFTEVGYSSMYVWRKT
jgi:spore coat polysaccharide biosynthesis protein SpsF